MCSASTRPLVDNSGNVHWLLKRGNAPEVACMNLDRDEALNETGAPSTLAPEIRVGGTSRPNTEEEMAARRRLYRNIEAKEI